MAWTIVGATQNVISGSDTLTINKPAGAGNGDYAWAAISYWDDLTLTPPSGWTLHTSILQAANGDKISIFKKPLGGSEPASYDWILNTADDMAGGILVVRGQDPTTPIDVTGSSSINASSTSAPAGSVTPTVNGDLLIYFMAASETSGNNVTSITATPPSGYDERVDQNGNPFQYVYSATKIQTTAASETPAATLSAARKNRAIVVAMKVLTAPNAPTLNSATGGNAQVSLAWSAPASGAAPTGYKVRYGTTSGLGTNIDVGNVTSYNVTSLSNGTLYYFAVSAYNAAGDGSNSGQLTATPTAGAPSAPTLSTATAGNAQVALTWTSVGSATSYKVKYGTSTGSYSTTLSVGNVTSYTVTGLGNGTVYYFVTVATNGSGDSGNSNELNATPQSGNTPNAPIFNSLVGTSTQLTATWSVVPNATGYKVKRGTAAGTYTTTVDVGNVTSYNITGLTNGTRYYVAIVAYNGIGDGGTSNELNAQPAATSYIKTKYNDISNGDILLFEQLFEIEAMTAGTHPAPDAGKIYKSVTVNGVNGYEFAVTRNVDGTGKNTWAAGSGYVNTGQAGSGFIDQYSYASVTSRPFEFICDGTAQVDPMSVDFTVLSGVSSMMYFGVASLKWDGLHLNITTPAVYTTATIVYEYWNGSAWTTLTSTVSAVNTSNVAVTADFKTVSRHSVVFTPPADWATGSVVGQTAYWIRIRVSAATGWTQNPKHSGGKWATRGKRQYGSTIAFMRRNSSTWNDISTRAAIGNLEGHYDYGTQIYGFAAGDVTGTWVGADTLNGFRVMNASTTLGKWDASGNITIGNPASANTYISAGVMRLRLGSTEVINFDAGSGNAYFNAVVTISATGEIRQGTGTVGTNYTGIRLFNSGGVGYLAGYNNNVVQWAGDTDGKFKAGAGSVILDSDGISIVAPTGAFTATRSYKFTTANNSTLGLQTYTSAGTTFMTLRSYANASVASYVAVESLVTGSQDGQSTLLAANASGQSYVNTTTLAGVNLYTDSGNINHRSTNGRNYFKDSESISNGLAGDGLRVGAAWGMYGIYAVAGACVVGGATGVNLQNGEVRVGTSGGVGIGVANTDTAYSRLLVSGGIKLQGGSTGYQQTSRDNGSQIWTNYVTTDAWRVWCDSTGDLARIDISGVASKLSAGTAWVSFSDARVKTIEGQYKRGLAEILRINPVVYDYNGKAGTIVSGKRNVGIIAQEIQKILPDTVTKDTQTEMLMFDATEVTWALVNAIKELAEEVASLKAKLRQ